MKEIHVDSFKENGKYWVTLSYCDIDDFNVF